MINGLEGMRIRPTNQERFESELEELNQRLTKASTASKRRQLGGSATDRKLREIGRTLDDLKAQLERLATAKARTKK